MYEGSFRYFTLLFSVPFMAKRFMHANLMLTERHITGQAVASVVRESQKTIQRIIRDPREPVRCRTFVSERGKCEAVSNGEDHLVWLATCPRRAFLHTGGTDERKAVIPFLSLSLPLIDD